MNKLTQETKKQIYNEFFELANMTPEERAKGKRGNTQEVCNILAEKYEVDPEYILHIVRQMSREYVAYLRGVREVAQYAKYVFDANADEILEKFKNKF